MSCETTVIHKQKEKKEESVKARLAASAAQLRSPPHTFTM